ncbi:MAG: NAD(P)H-dependent oxidoreductase, partial [Balneolaceae bacterium]|nr:NAD(P)H-dependent oxidoreductase [Balneolaceae bacterium]
HIKSMPLNIAVIYGSVRDNRKGIRAARFITKKCKERGFTTNLIDPLDYSLPLLKKMYKQFDEASAPEHMQKLSDVFKEADGYIIVSAEYNHSIPPALSNVLDHFLEEYFFKPSAILCYSAGSFGGVRAAMQLRAMLAEMGMSSIPSLLPVPNIGNAFEENGSPNDEAYHRRAQRFLDEFQWYTEALKSKRKEGTPY